MKFAKEEVGHFFRDVTALGSYSFYWFLLLVVLTFQEYSLFVELLVGFIVTAAIVVVVRSFYFKDRPKKETYSNWIERIDAASFPSLHAARVVFAVLSLHFFFLQSYVTLALVLIGLIVIYSRVFLKKHDWVDIIIGVLLGAAVYWGYLVI